MYLKKARLVWSLCLYHIYIYIHTHTHTHTYIILCCSDLWDHKVWHVIPTFWRNILVLFQGRSLPWRWRQHVLLQHWYPPNILHNVRIQKITIWSTTAIRPQILKDVILPVSSGLPHVKSWGGRILGRVNEWTRMHCTAADVQMVRQK